MLDGWVHPLLLVHGPSHIQSSDAYDTGKQAKVNQVKGSFSFRLSVIPGCLFAFGGDGIGIVKLAQLPEHGHVIAEQLC